MPKHIDMMRLREEEVFSLLELISQNTQGFSNPKCITIGGYAIRAYIPFSRYTRDCDFVLKKTKKWQIDEINRMLLGRIKTEIFEKKEKYGFLKMISIIQSGKTKIKVSLDFMEGQVRGRTGKQIVLIDEKFIDNSTLTKIQIAGKEIDIYVPDYTDYLIMKVVSGRPSDVRDIAALIWKNDVPKTLDIRLKEILPFPDIFFKNINEIVVPAISDKRFVNSWRGTFITTEFTEESKIEVLKKLTDIEV
ncbi:MAG: hypothetical protein JSV56_08360 [Methanomassiliicoccales archaeon]|nr:MAG: hypothetical protein JSV56_08360 [Methanomassiliicoccales archaeon]